MQTEPSHQNSGVISDYLKSLKSHSGNALKTAVALGLFSGLLVIFQAWLLAKTVTAVIFHQATLSDVTHWLAIMLILFVARAVLMWASEQVAFFAAAEVKTTLRTRLYQKLRKLGPVVLRNERAGEIANTLSDGIEALENYYARYLPAMALMALLPLSILVFIFPNDWLSGLIMLGTAPLIPFFMILVGKGAERKNQKQWRHLARMSAHFLDVIQGLTTLKLFNASRREAESVEQLSDEYRRSTMSVLRVAFLSSLALEFFATISIALVAVIIGFRLYWGTLDFQYGFFVLLLAPEFYLPLRNMGTHYHARMEAIGAAERILEIENMPIAETNKTASPLAVTSPLSILLSNVSYSYDSDRLALDNISLEIHPGEKIAIVGPSGSGKTTLINLLLGFIQPQLGNITVNKIPLEQFPHKEWMQLCAWVPQTPRLFQGSIADNIRLGTPAPDQNDIKKAAENARVHTFIQSLPAGYETHAGETGKGFSGGQIQRIALARAFLKNAPLLLLDEATASLDQQTEKEVSKVIHKLAEGRTTVLIAHRLSTIEHADRIIVLDQGKIIESGAHHELLQKNGAYRNLLAAGGLPV